MRNIFSRYKTLGIIPPLMCLLYARHSWTPAAYDVTEIIPAYSMPGESRLVLTYCRNTGSLPVSLKHLIKMDLLDQVMEATFASEQILQIESYANMRQFRTATELREGKGNHIAASIKILPPPKKDVTQKLELSLVPADGTDQVQHMIHPNFLCINIKDQRKIVYRNDLTHPGAWKADFMIKNEEVFHVDNITGEWRKVETLRDGNTLELGKLLLLRYCSNLDQVLVPQVVPMIETLNICYSLSPTHFKIRKKVA